MLTRKRKCPFDEYIESISISLDKRQKAEQFYENLRLFHRRKWGLSLKLPSVNGRNLNLHELYEAVISLGGWQKVTMLDRWNEVLQKLSIDESIQMAEHAIRFIYMQYLSKFEQNENGGDINDEHDSELLGFGGRSNRSKGINALTYYYEPPFSAPKTTSLNTNNNATPDFHKLVFSLLSGLPNEVAFGLNILTVMSHPGPFVLDFTHCPRLINILVAIVGLSVDMEDQESLSNLHNWWQEETGYNMTDFWMNSGIKQKELIQFIYNPKNLEMKFQDIFDDNDHFDLNKTRNWRVFIILGILNNLSFEDSNQRPMGENKPLLRFLLLCCNCRWQLLKRTAYETLSNIAKNINLVSVEETMPSDALFNTVQNGLNSNDRFEVVRSMEVIAGLSKVLDNETAICEFLDEMQILPRIFMLLSLKDIVLCVVSLETLLQISELSKTSCELIGVFNTAIDFLVGMLTTDAASFGQAGLYGIKVVEVKGHHMQPYVNPNKKNPPNMNASTSTNYSFQQATTMPLKQPQMTAPSEANSVEVVATKRKSSSKQKQSQSFHAIQAPHFENEYMCEWMMALDDGKELEPCSRYFQSTTRLLYHIYNDHLKTLVQSHGSLNDPDNVCMLRCRWPMCDNTPRTLWSMTTHIQDVHCTEYSLEECLRKRCEIGLDEYTNQIRQQYEKNREQIQQPGYSSFAAFEAIRRHAFVNMRNELTDDSEGPVTRNLRLTAALILRNICKHSVYGRRKLRKSEGFLSWLALSKLESSRTLSQCLAEIVKHSHSAATETE